MPVSPRVFVARAGRNGEDEDDALELGLAIIGFEGVASLASVQDYGQILQLARAGFSVDVCPVKLPRLNRVYADNEMNLA